MGDRWIGYVVTTRAPPDHIVLILGGGHRYSWILLDTVFFGYLANFWDPSIQVSKKKHVFTPNFLTLGTHRGRGLGLNSLLL